MDDDLGVAGRLEDRPAPVERAPELQRIGQIAVVGDCEPAFGELGEQWLDVPQARFARSRIAHVADAGAAGERADYLVAVEIAGDVAHAAVRMKMLAVEGRDAGGFLAAVLERVEAERDEAGGAVGTPNAENAAFFLELIVVERIGRQHVPLQAGVSESSYRVSGRRCRLRLKKAEILAAQWRLCLPQRRIFDFSLATLGRSLTRDVRIIRVLAGEILVIGFGGVEAAALDPGCDRRLERVASH